MLKGMQKFKDGLFRRYAQIRTAAAHVVEETAGEALTEARARVPVRTGRLKRSLRIRTDAPPLKARVFTECPYAAVVELGSARQRPQPYLGPAAARQRQDFPRKMRMRLNKDT